MKTKKDYSVAPRATGKYYRSRWFTTLEEAIQYAEQKTTSTGNQHTVRSINVSGVLWPKTYIVPEHLRCRLEDM